MMVRNGQQKATFQSDEDCNTGAVGFAPLSADRSAAVSPIMFSPKLKIDRTNFYRAQAEHYSEHYEGGWTINGSLCLK